MCLYRPADPIVDNGAMKDIILHKKRKGNKAISFFVHQSMPYGILYKWLYQKWGNKQAGRIDAASTDKTIGKSVLKAQLLHIEIQPEHIDLVFQGDPGL